MHSISESDKQSLLQVARQAIDQGLADGQRLHIELDHFSEALRKSIATFVTLTIAGKLAGCIGNLEANGPLVQVVTEHAYAAAFNDSRFAGINRSDLERLKIEIALLSKLQQINVSSEAALIDQLRVNTHGLLIDAPGHRATFLPKVWQALPDKGEFLAQLKLKAGLAKDYWSGEINCYLYTTESFSDV